MDNTTTSCNDNSVVKTIYDPCPAGFKMPAGNAFTGFTTTGNESTIPSEWNVSGDWDYGRNFNNKLTSPDATVYFPAFGFRYYNIGSLFHVGNAGYYWSAAPQDRYTAYMLRFFRPSVSPQYSGQRSYGYSARPVAE